MPFNWYINITKRLTALLMLQTSTTDSEFNLFPLRGIKIAPVTTLSVDEEEFYSSIKEELNKISSEPSKETIDRILTHSKTL